MARVLWKLNCTISKSPLRFRRSLFWRNLRNIILQIQTVFLF